MESTRGKQREVFSRWRMGGIYSPGQLTYRGLVNRVTSIYLEQMRKVIRSGQKRTILAAARAHIASVHCLMGAILFLQGKVPMRNESATMTYCSYDLAEKVRLINRISELV